MLAIFSNTLIGQRWAVVVASVGMAAFGLLLTISYESLGRQGLELFGESMPRGLSALMKAEGSLLAAAGPQGYLAIGFRHPLVLIVLAAYAISVASSSIAREIERRTILLVLARPIPRYNLVVSKGGALVIVLVALLAALLAGSFAGVLASGLGDNVDLGPFLIAGVNALALGLAIAGYSFLVSAMTSDGGRAILVSTGVTVMLFFLDFVSGLFDVLEPLGLLSLFHYYDPVSLVIEPYVPVGHLVVLLGVAAVSFAGAVAYFQRRDIAA